MDSLRNELSDTEQIIIPMAHPDTSEFYQCMAAAILFNFCKNPLYREYPWHGLQTLRRIIVKENHQDDYTKIQLQLLIHISKMNLKAHESARYINNLEFIVIHEPEDDSSRAWLQLAYKTISNDSVLGSIDCLMENAFNVKVEDTNKREVGASYIDLIKTELRGFSGFDWVYINLGHFDAKRYKHRKSRDCDVLVALDVVTLVIHEYAHVRIRQALNDMNMSTPTKVPKESLFEDMEFGRIVERHIFGAVPNWLNSYNRGTDSGQLLLEFAQAFITSIENNKKVPAVPLGLTLENRDATVAMGGADIQVERHIE
ncbi:uncharacterized protein LOC119071939 [Bradysia coprophila]|uniref:uncharacterized protein LOC119071939 n=1 Tax=Bradysia coprophila TaxID=38358 RepID=UPI00187DC0AD|nr:uncharacterized protein LOC119071939 [Bradysia coprophila]